MLLQQQPRSTSRSRSCWLAHWCCRNHWLRHHHLLLLLLLAWCDVHAGYSSTVHGVHACS
jgi:hypothetical protein